MLRYILFQEGKGMNQKKLSYEQILYFSAIILAAVLRFYQVGAAPLTDKEAYWANQALQVSQGDTDFEIGPNPGYVMLTGAVFFVFGSSEFSARFWPVLAGSLIILVPWLLCIKSGDAGPGRIALILLAIGLALDPGLVTISRQAGGPMMAISFSLIALAFGLLQKNIASGIFSGLALLSGPAVYAGILSMGIAGVVIFVNKKRSSTQQAADPNTLPDLRQNKEIIRWLLACAATVLIIGTFFLRFPQGLGAWLSSIQVYLEGWFNRSGNSIGLMFVAWIVFELMALVFFLSASGRRILQMLQDQSISPKWLSFFYIWLGTTLLLVVVYPAREMANLGWTIFPLWFIAAGELAVVLPAKKVSPISILLAIFTFSLMSLFWFTLSAISKLSPSGSSLDLRLLVPVGVLILIGLSAALVSLGWTPEVGQKGLAWGLSAALLIYSFAALSGAAYQRPNDPAELWVSLPGSGQNRLFQQTLEDVSRQLTGIIGAVDIIATPDSPSLRWSLRNYPKTRFVDALPSSEMPSIVITPAEQEIPALTAAYTGQDFVWWTWRGWSGTIPPDPIRWINYREAPIQNQKIILWIRTDLLPGMPLPAFEKPENP